LLKNNLQTCIPADYSACIFINANSPAEIVPK
jgi:hypothetical protein